VALLPQLYPWQDRTPDQMPKEIRIKLANTEQSIRGGQIHQATMYGPILTVIIGLIVLLVLLPKVPPGSTLVIDLLLLGFVALLIRLIWKWIEWSYSLIFITAYRIIYVHGILVRQVAMLPMSKVTDMRYDRTPNGQLLGYGRFIIESAGQDQALRTIDFVPEPDQTYRHIQNLLFSKGTQNVNVIDVNLLDKRKAIPVEVRDQSRRGSGGGQSDESTPGGDKSRPWWAE
jgi:membrane protein YdbS with pleckstrin-like domain